MHASFNKISKNIKIDGFRPGKIPAHVVQEHIGTGGIVSDAVNTGITNFLDHF
jgi:FKBP-type peptidyl-prolyl cis-trans isomerase (trigger factor)